MTFEKIKLGKIAEVISVFASSVVLTPRKLSLVSSIPFQGIKVLYKNLRATG